MRERFTGQVKDGHLILDDPARWRGLLARRSGKRVVVTLAREKVRRSLKANAYLWGVVYRTIAEWSGHDEEEIHEAMKDRFLAPRELVLPTGEELPMRGSTAILDNFDFSEYISKVKLWAAECCVHIPEPDEVELGEVMA